METRIVLSLIMALQYRMEAVLGFRIFIGKEAREKLILLFQVQVPLGLEEEFFLQKICLQIVLALDLVLIINLRV